MRTQRTTRLGLVAAALATLMLVGAPGALADRSYSDPAGDSGAAPDITSVAVSHDDTTVTFSVTTNQTVLSPDAMFLGYIDTDGNAATGFPGIGAEHFFLADDECHLPFLHDEHLLVGMLVQAGAPSRRSVDEDDADAHPAVIGADELAGNVAERQLVLPEKLYAHR